MGGGGGGGEREKLELELDKNYLFTRLPNLEVLESISSRAEDVTCSETKWRRPLLKLSY